MGKISSTLCWQCKRPGTRTCSWDDRLQPVKGWYAELVKYTSCGSKSVTYKVIECPLFIQDEVDKEAVKYSQLGPDKLDKMLDMLRKGLMQKEIAVTIGCHPATVSNYNLKWKKEGKL